MRKKICLQKFHTSPQSSNICRFNVIQNKNLINYFTTILNYFYDILSMETTGLNNKDSKEVHL